MWKEMETMTHEDHLVLVLVEEKGAFAEEQDKKQKEDQVETHEIIDQWESRSKVKNAEII